MNAPTPRWELMPEQPGRDVSPYMAIALDDIVDEIMLHGRYPAKGQPVFVRNEIISSCDAGELTDCIERELSERSYTLAEDIGRIVRNYVQDTEEHQKRAAELAYEVEGDCDD